MDSYRLLVLVVAYCGLRWGELAALEVGRVLSRRNYLRRPRHVDDEGRPTYVCSADPEEFAALGGRFLDEEIEAVAPATVI